MEQQSPEQRRIALTWEKLPKWGLLGITLQVVIMLVAGAPLNIIIQIAVMITLLGIGRYAARVSGGLDPMRRYSSSVTMAIYLIMFVAIASNAIALATSLPIDVETNSGQLMIFLSGLVVLPTMFAAGPFLEFGYWIGGRQHADA